MALKRKITKAEYDALSDGIKTEYKAEGDSYVLDLDDPAFDTLKAEKVAERARREKAEKDLQDLKDAAAEKARKEAEDKAKADGDVAALEKSWKEKRDADVAAEAAKAASATRALRSLLVDNSAKKIAEEISTVPELLVDKIKSRMAVEVHDEIPVLRILSADGKPSALSLDDLKKEFLDNPAYKAVIKGSNASGGGAGGGGQGGGAGQKKLSEMTATEEAKFANENPDEYARLVGSR